MPASRYIGIFRYFFSSFLQSYKTIPNWSQIEFREQWACNIPPFSLQPNVNFLNQPSQIKSVLDLDATMETEDANAETGPTRVMHASSIRRPARSVSESEQDLFGEDSDNNIEILPSPSKKQGLASI